MYIEIKVSHRYWSCKNRNEIEDIDDLSTMKNEYASETSPIVHYKGMLHSLSPCTIVNFTDNVTIRTKCSLGPTSIVRPTDKSSVALQLLPTYYTYLVFFNHYVAIVYGTLTVCIVSKTTSLQHPPTGPPQVYLHRVLSLDHLERKVNAQGFVMYQWAVAEAV